METRKLPKIFAVILLKNSFYRTKTNKCTRKSPRILPIFNVKWCFNGLYDGCCKKKQLKISPLLSPTSRNVWITCGFGYKLGYEDRGLAKPYNPPAATCNKLGKLNSIKTWSELDVWVHNFFLCSVGCTRRIFRIRSCSRTAYLKRKVRTRLDFHHGASCRISNLSMKTTAVMA